MTDTSAPASNEPAGLVLAAGASLRMGYPKALLPLPDTTPLALYQVRLLKAAGCARTVVVLGARAGEITRHLQDTEVVQHADWSRGRLSSLQAGLRALPNASGYLILPVDTVGVRVQTLQLVLRCARQEGVAAVRPFYEGKPGRLVWIRADLARAVLDLPPVDTPMDEWLAPRVKAISVEDAAILSNVNTPDDWTAARTNL